MIFSPFFVIFMQLFIRRNNNTLCKEIVVRYSGLCPLSYRLQATSDKQLHKVS
jgi:hypothetical protein